MSRSDRYAGWITYVQAHEPDGLPAQARIEDWGAGSAIVLGEPFEPIATGDLIAVQCVIDRNSSNASESSSPA